MISVPYNLYKDSDQGSAGTGSDASLAIFCKVVDNYGDIGICWRLARQLHAEHGMRVTLWVDDLKSFNRICPAIDTQASVQVAEGVTIRHWRDGNAAGPFSPVDIPDIVIEFFGCDIPSGYVDAMAQRSPRPVWLNLEGLSAEDWVEGCHTLPSSHTRLPLTKHFFFPGFTSRTGGLPHESPLEDERQAFQTDTDAMASFLARFGVAPAEMEALKVSLFCYPHAPAADLFQSWRDGDTPVICLVPEGVAPEAVGRFLEGEPVAGAARTRGALTLRIFPFIPQPDFDRLLWACDLNFVRGEDSFVRAQWAGRPFIWHIYPQDENLHHKKLRAFLQRYAQGKDSLVNLSLTWNDACATSEGGPVIWPGIWRSFLGDMPKLTETAKEWRSKMLANGDLAGNLIKFAASLKSLTAENKQ